MVRVINNYSFVSQSVPGAMVDPKKRRMGERISLRGIAEGDLSQILGPQYCTQANVKAIGEGGTIVTNHNVYQLGTIDPSYQAFLDATRRGIQIIVNWTLYGSKEHGYCLTGDRYPQLKSIKISKIISVEDGNILKISPMVDNNSGDKNQKCAEMIFVCWNSISRQAVREIETRRVLADIEYEKFEVFNGAKCKPPL